MMSIKQKRMIGKLTSAPWSTKNLTISKSLSLIASVSGVSKPLNHDLFEK